jgi:hypothetical protein
MAVGSRAGSRNSLIAAITAAVSIEDVLAHHDCAVPKKGNRTRCPVHEGRNPTAFVIGDGQFRCFSCDAHGDVVDLERELGGGTIADAVRRLAERHGLRAGAVDWKRLRRRAKRLRRLNEWHRGRVQDWLAAVLVTERAVESWQSDPALADDTWWDELQSRCEARDRSEAMFETFRELRTTEQRAKAYVVERRGVVCLPSEAQCVA